jgi:TctA family transporter
MNSTNQSPKSVLNKDTQALLLFYSVVLGSAILFFYWADVKNPRQIILHNIILGLVWAVMGVYNAQKLQKIYQKPFMKLEIREQKYISISLIIAAFGFFMLIWKSWQWFA